MEKRKSILDQDEDTLMQQRDTGHGLNVDKAIRSSYGTKSLVKWDTVCLTQNYFFSHPG